MRTKKKKKLKPAKMVYFSCELVNVENSCVSLNCLLLILTQKKYYLYNNNYYYQHKNNDKSMNLTKVTN